MMWYDNISLENCAMYNEEIISASEDIMAQFEGESGWSSIADQAKYALLLITEANTILLHVLRQYD